MNKYKNLSNSVKVPWLVIGILIFAVIKQLLMSTIYIYAIGYAVNDDVMMINMASNIAEGNWLGAYNIYKLVKGSFFPFLLAVFNWVGIPYLAGYTLLYSLACIIFIYAVKPIFRSKISLFILYIVLLFNPVSYAFLTVQRVYRNGITLVQVLVFFGCMIGMYLRRNEETGKLVKWSIGASLAVATLWHTREDGIWIIPFLLVATIIMLVSGFFSFKGNQYKGYLRHLIVTLLPIVILFGSNIVISAINHHYYGVYTYNEINDSSFGKAIKSFYSVKNNKVIPYVSVTREKVERLYEVCPTLKEIESYLNVQLDNWDNNDSNPGDGEVEDGWFFWSLRDAVSAAGYHENAVIANEFYARLSTEIDLAIEEGKIESQATMPSSLMSPWRKGYESQLIKALGKVIKCVLSYEGVTTELAISDFPNNISEMNVFEAITNDRILSPQLSGESPDNLNVKVEYSKKYVNRMNFIGTIYKKTGIIVAIAGILAYIYIAIIGIKKYREKGNLISDTALALTGILGSLLVLFIGVAYSHISAFNSANYFYLSGSYPLIIAFSIISICIIIENIKYKVRK